MTALSAKRLVWCTTTGTGSALAQTRRRTQLASLRFLVSSPFGDSGTNDLDHSEGQSSVANPLPENSTVNAKFVRASPKSWPSSSLANPNHTQKQKPVASNAVSFQKAFFGPEMHHEKKRTESKQQNHKHYKHPPKSSNTGTGTRLGTRTERQTGIQREHQTHPLRLRHEMIRVLNKMRLADGATGVTMANLLKAQGETIIPTSTWVKIEGISPISTLEAMLTSVTTVLDEEERRGMIDLDAIWKDGQSIPFLAPNTIPKPEQKESSSDNISGKTLGNSEKWVRQAWLILSPFGRPVGWYMRFDNRSVVYALLKHAKEKNLHCAWKVVTVQEYKCVDKDNISDDIGAPTSQCNFQLNEHVSDYTLRVENCPGQATDTSLLNFFSRYDLQFGERAIHRWRGTTNDGKKCPPTTCFIHFADASWARAAVREKQGSFLQKFGKRVVVDERNPQPLRLVQFPRQIL